MAGYKSCHCFCILVLAGNIKRLTKGKEQDNYGKRKSLERIMFIYKIYMERKEIHLSYGNFIFSSVYIVKLSPGLSA